MSNPRASKNITKKIETTKTFEKPPWDISETPPGRLPDLSWTPLDASWTLQALILIISNIDFGAVAGPQLCCALDPPRQAYGLRMAYRVPYPNFPSHLPFLPLSFFTSFSQYILMIRHRACAHGVPRLWPSGVPPPLDLLTHIYLLTQ